MNNYEQYSEPEFRAWLTENKTAKPSELRLKYSRRKDGKDYSLAITQIECRQRFGRKLADTLAADPDFIFPSVLSGEQSSGDAAASFHTETAQRLTHNPHPTAIDLTSGLGIDVLHLARAGFKVTAVEREPDIAEALRHNSRRRDVTVICDDCRNVAAQLSTDAERQPYDIVFIDPARRSDSGGRLFSLADCHPDVVEMLPTLLVTGRHVIVKASPMLDITETGRQLHPEHIYVLGTATECKELVAVVGQEKCDHPVITAVSLGEQRQEFSYRPEEDKALPLPNLAIPESGAYICDPAPALLKAGAIRSVAARYGLQMFDYNARLYYSTQEPTDFPGRVRRITEVVPYTSSNIKRLRQRYPQINVTARNFNINAEQLSAKLKVKTGGELRLYAVPSPAGPVMIIT